MSYDIYIGEARLLVDCDDDSDTPSIDATVDELELPDAPAFPNDDMTGRGNHRHPGYSQWSKWCTKVGLSVLMFGPERGLMRNHPGTVGLKQAHLEAVVEARRVYQSNAKPLEPGWCGCRKCSMASSRDVVVPHVDRDPDLARLIWLEWWMGWALKHCKIPAFHNR